MSSTKQEEQKGKISITIEPELQRAVFKIVSQRIQKTNKSVSFSAVLNELALKGLKCKA